MNDSSPGMYDGHIGFHQHLAGARQVVEGNRELLLGRKLSVQAPFFNTAFTPFIVGLAVILPIGAMLPWKRAKLGRTARAALPVRRFPFEDFPATADKLQKAPLRV